jgi:hypothetical protein
MSDEKNEKNAEQTARLDELFATAPARGEQDGDEAGRPGATAPTTVLPEAEPAWLRGESGPQRSTPRIRWAGIVWGLIFAATGWFAVWTLAADSRRAAFADWFLTLDRTGWAVVGALVIGAILVLIGLTQALKAATRGPRP